MYRNASSFTLNGSAPWTKTPAMNIVKAIKIAAGRVKRPMASNTPPTSSLNAAAWANITGIGKPIDATPWISCSEIGNFPRPCTNAITKPANSLKSKTPTCPALPELVAKRNLLIFIFRTFRYYLWLKNFLIVEGIQSSLQYLVIAHSSGCHLIHLDANSSLAKKFPREKACSLQATRTNKTRASVVSVLSQGMNNFTNVRQYANE